MKTASLAAAALVAALGLAACGSGTAGTGSTAASSTSRTSSAAPKAGDTVDAGALSTRMREAMTKAGSGSVKMSLGSAGTATGEFSFDGSSMDQRMTMDVNGQQLEVVTKGGTLYIKGLPGAKPWVKIDPKAKDPVSSLIGRLSGRFGDPRQLAKSLAGTKATVVSSSDSQVVYDVTMDPSAVLGSDASGIVPTSGPVTVRYTLDSQGRPVSVTTTSSGQTVTVTYSDWGTSVAVTAPPADQVGTFTFPGS
jgi:YD repeat-containing protein